MNYGEGFMSTGNRRASRAMVCKQTFLGNIQDSLSSTFCQKVELSSDEDHDSAHKPGDVGNSSNESNMTPFDIFFEKKGVVLKPSLLGLNREKTRASEGYTGIVIRPGMVLLKNYLSIKDQVMIVKKCRQLGLGEGGFYQPGFQNGGSLHLKMMCLGKNWDCQTRLYGETRPFDGSTPPQTPVEFSQLVRKAIKDSQSIAATNSKKTKGDDEIPFYALNTSCKEQQNVTQHYFRLTDNVLINMY